MQVSELAGLPEWLADDADLVLVNPPFGGTDRPSLALHLLQAIGRQEGAKVKVLYANLLLAEELGEAVYEGICYASSGALLGERFFAEVAYGKPPSMEGARPSSTYIRTSKIDKDLESLAFVYDQRNLAFDWCGGVADLIAASGAKAVGFTSTFEQTAAAVALARAVGEVRSDVLLLIGGANTEGEMAEGIATLAPFFDFIFTGESEESFRLWCREYLLGPRRDEVSDRTSPLIVKGSPCTNLDELPCPEYDDYYHQLRLALPESELLQNEDVWLPYETSRGCWWGEKHHCTFCGINGEGMAFRQKSAPVVLNDLETLTARHPTNRVLMVDNIMPHKYFTDLLPNLADRQERLHIFYEQKANLDFRRVWRLKQAGVEVIQPGIEALDSALLRHMRKGVRARQNVALLRYSLMNGVFVNWNLLHSFPGDHLEWYQNTLELIPLLSHLCPPTGVFGLSIDRFSPYFDQAEHFGVHAVTPVGSYFDVLPEDAPVDKIAYHFEASYESDSRSTPQIIHSLEEAVASWRSRWQSDEGLPKCHIVALDQDNFMLIDTRPEVGSGFRIIDEARARVALWGDGGSGGSDPLDWAYECNVCVSLDGVAVPLATSSTELFLSMDDQGSREIREFEGGALIQIGLRSAAGSIGA